MSENSSAPISNILPYCLSSELAKSISHAIIGAKFCTHIPASILILLLCSQQWRRRRSFAAMSHSDVFAFHQSVIHLVTVFAAILFFCVQHTGQSLLFQVCIYFSSIAVPAELFLHVLTGVERYVAVIHPVTYLGLRQAGGVRIRNISIGCVWLLCCGWMGVMHVTYPDLPYITLFCILAFTLTVITFCSLSVLCALIGPGPGKVGSDNQHTGHLKLRAFNTISTIMAILLLYLVAVATALAVKNSNVLSYNTGCVILMSVNWLALISGLVLPLLFLHRAGKLPCCRGKDR